MLTLIYCRLGVPGLSSLVEERQQISGLGPDNRPNQRTALHLQSIVRERARLFLYDYSKESLHPNRESKWLEKNLTVQTVRSIVIKTSMRGTDIKHIQEKTATLRQESNRNWVICITEKYNMAQVSRALARLLLVRPKPRDWMVLTEFLRSELSGLQEAGINVDRILRQKEKEAKVAEERHQHQLEQEQRARDQREALQREMNIQGGQGTNKDMDEQTQDSTPGTFPGSSDGMEHKTEDKKEPESLFGGFKKMFGLDTARKPQPTLSDGERIAHDDNAHGIEHEPPYSASEPNEKPSSTKPPATPMTPQQLHDL